MAQDIKTINIEDITSADLVNCRDSYEDVSDLIESMGATGLQMPIGVTKTGDSFGLVYGFRRLHAAKSLGWHEIEARILQANTEADLLILNLQENVTRRNLTPIEEANAIKRILDAGKSEAEIQSALGFTKTLITQRIALLTMSEEIQNALKEDGISVGQARAISEAPSSHQERLIELAKCGATTKAIRQESDLLNDLMVSSFMSEEIQDQESFDDRIDHETGEVHDSIETYVDEGVESLDSSIKSSLLDLLATLLDDPRQISEIGIAIRSIDFNALLVKDASLLDNALASVTETSPQDTWGAFVRKVAK